MLSSQFHKVEYKYIFSTCNILTVLEVLFVDLIVHPFDFLKIVIHHRWQNHWMDSSLSPNNLHTTAFSFISGSRSLVRILPGMHKRTVPIHIKISIICLLFNLVRMFLEMFTFQTGKHCRALWHCYCRKSLNWADSLQMPRFLG